MSKTVFILGAGASISHSKGNFPSYNDFFSKARNLNLINNKNSGKVLKKYASLRKYILKVMKIDILSEKSEIDIERLMTFIDIEIENADNRESYQIYKKRLLEIIIFLFKELSNNLKAEKGDYNDFVKNIKDNHTVITFNWDVLLDKLFMGRNQYSNLTNLIAKDRSPIILDEPINSNILSKESYYLKLHGSVDWKYCTNKDCDAHNKIFISTNNLCGTCFKILNTLIIPPIINKQFKIYPFIEKLWELGSKQLDVAQEIVIWGYRLPPTDFYSNWLLSKTSTNVKTVSIINPDCILSGEGENIRLNKKNFLKPFYRAVYI